MKRAFGCLINLLLALISAGGTFYLVVVADKLLAPFVFRSFAPGEMGLIFTPNNENEYDMHDYHVFERINSLGFRDREFTLEKTDAFRIVALGDSFTFGWGVNLEDTWVKRLESNLLAQGRKVEVMNLGKPAAGPFQYANIAESILPVLKPDLVLVGVLTGDDFQQIWDAVNLNDPLQQLFPNILRWIQLQRTAQPNFGFSKQTAEDTRKGYIQTAQDVLRDMSAEQRERYEKLPEEVRKVFLEGRLNPWMIGHTTGSPDYFMNTVHLNDLYNQIQLMATQMERIRTAADKIGAQVLVLDIPEGFYVNKEAWENVQQIGFQAVPEMLTTDTPDVALGQACEKAGVPYASVTEGFRKRMDARDMYLELDRHMAPKGNILFGNLITPIVEKMIDEKAPRRPKDK